MKTNLKRSALHIPSIIVLMLVFCLLGSSMALAAEPATAAAPADEYYSEAFAWAAAQGIGSETEPDPEAYCSRAQALYAIWQMYGGYTFDFEFELPFADVAADDYYYPALRWAYAVGVAKGTSADAFSPELPVSRAQFLTFLYRVYGFGYQSPGANPFADVREQEYYFYPVLWAAERGITNGTAKNAFSPDDACTQAQALTLMFRQAQLLEFYDSEIDWDTMPEYYFDDEELTIACLRAVTLNAAWEGIMDGMLKGAPALNVVNSWLAGNTDGAQFREDGSVCAYLFSSKNAAPDNECVDLIIYVDEKGRYCAISGSFYNWEPDWETEGLVTAHGDYDELLAAADKMFELDLSEMPVQELIEEYFNGDLSGAQFREDGSVFAYLFVGESDEQAEEQGIIRFVILADREGNYSGMSYATIFPDEGFDEEFAEEGEYEGEDFEE